MCRAARSPSVPSVTSRTLLRPPPVDVAIAAAFVAFAVAEGLAGPDDQPWWRAVAAGFAAALLAWRRQAPILVAALVVLVNVLTDPEAQFSTLLSLVLVCFTVGYETRRPRSYAGLAIVLSRVQRLVFGAFDDKAGAVGSLWDVVRDRRHNHRPEVVSGVLADECSALLLDFFAAHRG